MRPALLVLLALAASNFCLPAGAAEGEPKSTRPAIYDQTADGEKQIAAALAVARKENKRVLVQFGANWCGWCHKLHHLFQTDAEIAAKLKAAYVVVLLDVNQGHNEATNKRYGNPTQFGLPVIVILDAEGKQLTTQDTGKLEAGDHHDPKKVLAFLNQWASKDS
jgi:thiol:disulfide interchange protein